MNILVTGGAGFIGSHLCEELLARGNSVTCIDNLSTGNMKNIKLRGDFKFIQADINSTRSLNKLNGQSFDQIFHYSALVGVDRTLNNPEAVLEDKKGIKNILDFAVSCGAKKFFYASSSEVYGEPLELPQKEDSMLNGQIHYSKVKLFGEQLLQRYYSEFGIKTLSLRLFNVYGPRQDADNFVVNRMIKSALASKPIDVFGSGLQTRDFVFIKDNIHASLLAADCKNCYNIALNIGTGIETPIAKLAETINRLTGNKNPITFLDKREYEISRRCAAIDNLARLTGFKPEYSLEKGLAETIEWFKIS